MYEEVAELLGELSEFPGREKALRNIKRFSLYNVVFYRFSDFSHSKRVAWHVARASDVLARVHPNLDLKRTLAIALVHDDAEIITGDHQAGNKSKMTPAQLAALEDEERLAIQTLGARFPLRLGRYLYKELLEEALELGSPEAQIAKYLDRQDALGETLHELYGGNTVLTVNVVNSFGTIPTPFDFYLDKQPAMIERYPSLVMLKGQHAFFDVPEARDWKTLVTQQPPHTAESITRSTGHPQYEQWKGLIFDSKDSEEIENLYTQREFLS